MTGSGACAAADAPQRPASFRESAEGVVRYEEEYSVIEYNEPWSWTHLVGWLACLFWNGVTALFLTFSPWLALVLAGHLYAGVSMAYEMLRWGRSKFTLVVSPSHLECEVRPFSAVWAWQVTREDIADVLVTQRLSKGDPNDWAEWVVSVRLQSGVTHVLLRRNAAPDAPLPEGMDQLARQLAYELLRPVTRETLDEREG